jgi:TP901-1 family phage major tail protein
LPACEPARSPSTRRRSTSPTRSRRGAGASCSRARALKTARITGSGIFKDAASDETLRAYFFAGTVRDWHVIVPDLGTVEGKFQIATLEYGGQHDGEVTFDLSLESAGALSFTAAG